MTAEHSENPGGGGEMAETVIRPERGLFNLNAGELWRYRGLLYVLSRRAVVSRYKQTAVGVAWVVLQPLIMMALLLFVFNYLARMQTPPLAVFAATLAWQIFATGFGRAATSVAGEASLVTKVYFPRLIIPTSACLVAMVDFLVSLPLFLLVAAYYGELPGARLLALPLFVLPALVFTLGTGYLFAALNVRYRDVKHVAPLLLQVGFYASPVGYLACKVPAAIREWYYLNPMAAAIDGFRWALLPGQELPAVRCLLLSAAAAAAALLLGLLVFKRMEHSFADEI